MSEPYTDDFAMVTRIRLHDDDSEATMQTVAHGLQRGMVLITPDLEASSEDEGMVVEIDATAYGNIETLGAVLSMVVQTLETHQEDSGA